MQVLSASNIQWLKQLATVSGGVVFAQTVNFLTLPVLAAMFGPDLFGLRGTFIAVVGVLLPVATGALPFSIPVQRNKVGAFRAFWASSFFLAIFCAIVFVVLAADLEGIRGMLLDAGLLDVSLLIPIAVFGFGLLDIARAAALRNYSFAVISVSLSIAAVVVSSMLIYLGSVKPTSLLLIAGVILLPLLQASLILLGLLWRRVQFATLVGLRSLLLRGRLFRFLEKNKDFPLYRAPQSLLNAVSAGAPVIVVAASFGADFAGQYALARSLVEVPIILIGNAVSDLLVPRLNEFLHCRRKVREMIAKSFILLLLLGGGPLLFVFSFGDRLSVIFLGGDWAVMGEVASWMSIWLFFVLFNKPCVAAIPFLGLQRSLLIWEMFNLGAKAMAIVLGAFLYQDFMAMLKLLCVFGALSNFVLVLWVVKHVMLDPAVSNDDFPDSE